MVLNELPKGLDFHNLQQFKAKIGITIELETIYAIHVGIKII